MHVYMILIQSITKISNAKLFTHSTFEISRLEENNFVNLQLDFQTTSSLKKKKKSLPAFLRRAFLVKMTVWVWNGTIVLIYLYHNVLRFQYEKVNVKSCQFYQKFSKNYKVLFIFISIKEGLRQYKVHKMKNKINACVYQSKVFGKYGKTITKT